MVRELKKKEKSNEQIDFDKINLIDSFINMRQDYLVKK